MKIFPPDFPPDSPSGSPRDRAPTSAPASAQAIAAGGALSAVRTDRTRLLHLRWLSVLAMGVIVVVVFPWLAPAHPHEPMLGVALALTALNLALLAGAARWLAGRWGAFMQLALDLLAWGAFLYFGGGVTNPAISLLLPLVAVGAAILPPRQAWSLMALAVATYSVLWQFHHPVQLTDRAMAMHWHLSGMWLSFVVSALTVVWFVVHLNAALSRREQALAASNAARARDAYVVGLGKLAAGAAHRLGTPLGTLRILVDELVRRPELAPEAREDLELMREQVDHCRDILNQLTRESGQQRAESGGAVSAGVWLDAVVGRWRMLRPHASALLECTRDAAAVSIVADASLAEALHNLIDNAANANTKIGRAEAVELDAHLEDDRFVVEVADRGPGMSDAVRAAMRRTPFGGQASGMGVGLLLAQAAIEHHGGRLDFRPRPDGGTIARLAIPIQALIR
ncbi:MAG: ATP-binding protein [Azoarcus sp.]|nr:ATP-binding protein [Azoarcus sp.]